MDLRREIARLRKHISEVQSEIDWEIQEFDHTTACCPDCAIPGFTEMRVAQLQRRVYLQELEAKLNK